MTDLSKKKTKNLGWYLLLCILFFYLFIPFWWMVVTSFKTYTEVYDKPYALMLSNFHWQNYPDVLKSMPFFTYLLNTIKVSVWVCIGTLITSGMAAYAFSRLHFPGRDKLFYIYLATLMVPRQVILIPNFLLFRKLGL